jgi:hypothetical protein
MRILFAAGPALLLAGVAVAQSEDRPNPVDPRAKVPPVEFRSAFEGYRPFVEQELRDWRKSNEEAGAKPQPGKPESAGGPAGRNERAPADQGHGGHK